MIAAYKKLAERRECGADAPSNEGLSGAPGVLNFWNRLPINWMLQRYETGALGH